MSIALVVRESLSRVRKEFGEMKPVLETDCCKQSGILEPGLELGKSRHEHLDKALAPGCR